MVTSFLSLCIGFVTYRKMLNGEEWTLADMVVDMLWNVFSVSPRVIALVLFASYKLYWFWGIVAAQVGFGVIISSVCSLLKQESNHQRANKIISLFKVICKGLFISMGNVFTMFVATSLFFPIYILYWIVMYIENAVMMSFWHSWSENLGFWYHDIVVRFVFAAYAASLLIKCIHCWFYKPNMGKINILKWYFYKADDREEGVSGEKKKDQRELIASTAFMRFKFS